MTTTASVREIVACLAIVYSLALTVALALPDAHVNLLLSVAVPTVPAASAKDAHTSTEPLEHPGIAVDSPWA